MNAPRIQNDDRGFTVNKSLAWTMVTGLLVAGVWLGTTVGRLDERVGHLEVDQIEGIDRMARIEARMRPIETQAEGFRRQLENIEAGISRIERRLEAED